MSLHAISEYLKDATTGHISDIFISRTRHHI
jgi:hypothetical protein